MVDDLPLNSIHDLFDAAVISVIETYHSQNHIPDRYYYHMGCNGVITCAMAFRPQAEMTFANQKILLCLPSDRVRTEHFLGRTFHVGADKADPLLPVVPVADIYKLCRDGVSVFIRNLYIDTQKISGTPGTFFVAAVDFLYCELCKKVTLNALKASETS